MSTIVWKSVEAKLSLKQTQWEGLFSKRYSFLILFSLRIDSDQTEEELSKYIEGNTFMETPDFTIKMPSARKLFGLPHSDEPEVPMTEPEKKVRGTLMFAQDVEVLKAVFNKYEESQKITIEYDSKDPYNIRIS